MLLIYETSFRQHPLSDNVGAIFRTAEACAVSEIILLGITPTPLDRFGRERSDFARSAVGAQSMVTWKYFDDKHKAFEYLEQSASKIIALELTANSQDYKNCLLKSGANYVLLVGSETDGVSDWWLDRATHICHIPMRGKKESLNVSTACGIALFRLLDQ